MKSGFLKKLLWGISSIIFLTFALFVYYSSLYGNPFHFYTAKAYISQYIDEHYRDVLILEDVRYDGKMNEYVGKVTDANDSRCKSFIGYNPKNGYLDDDYYFRTKTGMEDSLITTLSTLASTVTGIPSDKLHFSPTVEIPQYKYRMYDKFSSDIPVKLDLSVEKPYNNINDFSDDAFKLLQVLYFSKIHFTDIEIYAFTPDDGNKAYQLSLSVASQTMPNSADDVKKLAYVKGYKK